MSKSQGPNSKSDMDNKVQDDQSCLKDDNIQFELIFDKADNLLKEYLNKDVNDTRIVQLLVKLDSYIKIMREKNEVHAKTLKEISVKDETIRTKNGEITDLKNNVKHLENKLKECKELNKKLETSHNIKLNKIKDEYSAKVLELNNKISELEKEIFEINKKPVCYNVNTSNLSGTQTINMQSSGKRCDDKNKLELEKTIKSLENKTIENDKNKLELEKTIKSLVNKTIENDKNKLESEKTIKALENQTVENDKNKLELEKTIKALEEKTVENDDWKKKYDESEDANSHLTESNNQYQKEIENLKNEIENLKEQLNTVTHTPTTNY